jgi:hypothetical protein
VRRLRVGIALGYRRGRNRGGRPCAASGLRVHLRGADVRSVRRVDFFVGRRRLASDRRARFGRRLARRTLRRGLVRLRLVLTTADGSQVPLARTVYICP